ncbi:MAG: hypothetical protein IKA23_01960 [Akkermansia sp.]|nr:hypothetical protein [Akkermansia sp.]
MKNIFILFVIIYACILQAQESVVTCKVLGYCYGKQIPPDYYTIKAPYPAIQIADDAVYICVSVYNISNDSIISVRNGSFTVAAGSAFSNVNDDCFIEEGVIMYPGARYCFFIRIDKIPTTSSTFSLWSRFNVNYIDGKHKTIELHTRCYGIHQIEFPEDIDGLLKASLIRAEEEKEMYIVRLECADENSAYLLYDTMMDTPVIVVEQKTKSGCKLLGYYGSEPKNNTVVRVCIFPGDVMISKPQEIWKYDYFTNKDGTTYCVADVVSLFEKNRNLILSPQEYKSFPNACKATAHQHIGRSAELLKADTGQTEHQYEQMQNEGAEAEQHAGSHKNGAE